MVETPGRGPGGSGFESRRSPHRNFLPLRSKWFSTPDFQSGGCRFESGQGYVAVGQPNGLLLNAVSSNWLGHRTLTPGVRVRVLPLQPIRRRRRRSSVGSEHWLAKPEAGGSNPPDGTPLPAHIVTKEVNPPCKSFY